MTTPAQIDPAPLYRVVYVATGNTVFPEAMPAVPLAKARMQALDWRCDFPDWPVRIEAEER